MDDVGEINWHTRVDFRRIGVDYFRGATWESEKERKRSIRDGVMAAKKTLRKWGCKSAVLLDEPIRLGCVHSYQVVGRDAPLSVSFHDWWREL